MFGYITVHKDELKIKDFDRYNAYYCGVCRSLRNNYGIMGQMTLTYDMTFLAILLSSLYEDETDMIKCHCITHPIKKHNEINNEYTDYAAAINVMLSYYKLKDDWEDDRSVKSSAVAGLLKKAFKKAIKQYPGQAKAIEKYIHDQHKFEKEGETDIDLVSACTGEMLAAVFDMKNDVWKNDLHRMGMFMGRFIYVMDAYDDIDKDIKKNNYNPLKERAGRDDFEDYCKNVLTMYAAECARAFERLPIISNTDILRNIIYAGMWCKFNKISEERRK